MAEEDKLPVQETETSSLNFWDIVVALDIGTSYSGYAYSDKKEIKRDEINLNEWSGNFTHDKKAKAPTVVLLNKDKSFNSFGYDAEEQYADMVQQKEHQSCYRFCNFKMELYLEKNVNDSFEIKDDKGRPLPAMEIFAFTIKALKDHFEKTAMDKTVVYKPENVLYVMTVPAIWSESNKEFMKKAAIKAGIGEFQIRLALEPEAAALYCKTLPDRMLTASFEPGSKYMVLDMGGGTVDIVVHKIMEDGTLTEVHKASGGDFGGTTVDKKFKEYVYKLLKNEKCFKELWESAPLDALEFEREFEAKKRQVSKDKKKNLRLQLPLRLKQFSKIKLDVKRNKSITFAHMYVQNEEFKTFFITAKSKIIETIETMLVEIGTIDFIILVGGFSCSNFLTDEIKSHPGFSSIKFISPKDPDTVVLQGAVLFGYNPRAINARICRYTYGIRVRTPFDVKIHPQSKHAIEDGDELCIDVFHVLVYKDELIQYGDVRNFAGVSKHRNTERKFVTINIELFQAKNVEKGRLAFVTDEGFKSLGKIVCKPPENGWPDIVNYATKIYFGRTSIQIENYDTANKEQIKSTFELD